MQRKERKPHIELLLGDELQSLFSSGFNKDCLDPLGYDLRLGEEVTIVTRPEHKSSLKGDEEITIYPGETFIAKTEEVLNLPLDVFAIGSPKMSLLARGLWTHGGKTDPGYKNPLVLGFFNAGNQPISVKRSEKFFISLSIKFMANSLPVTGVMDHECHQ
jgi:deoxycytidine triphosphate deaminase